MMLFESVSSSSRQDAEEDTHVPSFPRLLLILLLSRLLQQ